jgi:hypothetical protein
MNITEIPDTIVSTPFAAARWPLTLVASRLADEVDTWPPLLAFDSIEATVERSVGTVLRDERLIERGRSGQERVEHLRSAIETDAAADRLAEHARRRLESGREAADDLRTAAERRAADREANAQAREAQRKREAQESARRKKQAADKVARVAESAVDRKARAATLDTLQAEERALAKKQAALAAKRKGDRADAAIAATKAARKATRSNGR